MTRRYEVVGEDEENQWVNLSMAAFHPIGASNNRADGPEFRLSASDVAKQKNQHIEMEGELKKPLYWRCVRYKEETTPCKESPLTSRQ